MAHIRPKPGKAAFFNPETVKNISFFSAQTVTVSVLLGHVLPHTALAIEYRDFIRLYNKGIPVPVPENVNQRFQKTLDLLQMSNYDRPRFIPFMACGFDMFSLGTYGRFGVHIGIPVNFTYDSVKEVDTSRILINQEPVNWESVAGKQLLKALVVPESGQLYAMAREIKLRDSWKIFIDTSLALTGCVFTYFSSMGMNKRLNLYDKPRRVRLVGYALIAAFNLVNFFLCKDLIQNVYEEKIDKELKALNPIFAEGGKQFYTQILERNKALRELMGKEGEKMFTILGNENNLIRNKHSPIVQRKAFFEEKNNVELKT